jgi:hypothetical protein
MSNSSSSPALIILDVVFIALGVFEIAALWQVFTKAGRPGWLAIIPIVNLVVLCNIVGLSPWWLLLILVPFVDFVFLPIYTILISWNLGKSFGQGAGFRIGLIFLGPIFIPMLAFGNARYLGKAATA